MSEQPPKGSLLSNFIFGSGNKPPVPPSFPKKEKDELSAYVYNPALRKWVPRELRGDQAAQLGQLAANIPLNQIEGIFGSVKDGLLGQGVLKRFGEEDQVIRVAYDYLDQSLQKTNNTQLKEDLDIDTLEKFDQKYRPFIREEQQRENEQRIKDGKPPIEGFGNYQVKAYRGFLLNPITAAKSLSKTALSLRANEFLKEEQYAGDHPELSSFTKEEQSRYLPKFFDKLANEKQQEAAKLLGIPAKNVPDFKLNPQTGTYQWTGAVDAAPKALPLDQNTRDRIARLNQSLQKIPEVKKTVHETVLNRSFIGRSLVALSGVYRELQKIDRDPIGYIPNKILSWVTKPVRDWWERTKREVKRRMAEWLLKQSGQFGRLLLRVGWEGLKAGGRAGSRLAFASGRLLIRVGQIVFRTVASVGVRASIALVGAITATVAVIGLPIILFVGAILLAIVALTLVVMFVFIPLFTALNPPVAAAPTDLAITVQVTPSSGVGSNQLLSGNVTVMANKEAQNFYVAIVPDSHFIIISGCAEGVTGGDAIRCPASTYNLPQGQSVTYTFSVRTTSSMTASTVASIEASAFSDTTSANSSIFYVNGQGIVGADPKIPFGWPVSGNLQDNYFGYGTPLHTDLYGFRVEASTLFYGTAVDINGNNEARVCATMEGRVTATGDDSGGLGPFIVNDISGYATRYHHMLLGSVAVKVGDTVTRGQFLGLVDTTGIAYGPNLHYAIWRNGVGVGKDFYRYLPPGYLDSSGNALKTDVRTSYSC